MCVCVVLVVVELSLRVCVVVVVVVVAVCGTVCTCVRGMSGGNAAALTQPVCCAQYTHSHTCTHMRHPPRPRRKSVYRIYIQV